MAVIIQTVKLTEKSLRKLIGIPYLLFFFEKIFVHGLNLQVPYNGSCDILPLVICKRIYFKMYHLWNFEYIFTIGELELVSFFFLIYQAHLWRRSFVNKD